MPVAISFTVETDGRLPSGQGLGEAIEQVDDETDRGPAYYMINCAHPTHFDGRASRGREPWRERIRGVRANASTMSHAELDEATSWTTETRLTWAPATRRSPAKLPNLNVLGGCCGTDHRHVREACEAWPTQSSD